MIKFFFLVFFLISNALLWAQPVPKLIIVEHFTNSVCSVCANRNPGFYSNLNQEQDVLHVAYHPSAPYPSCTINKFNKTANDARTNFYGVYGSTPRLVINGKVIPAGANYSAPELFDPFENQTSAVDLELNVSVSGDTLVFELAIKIVDENTIGNASAYIALVQNEYEFNAPNGEQKHFDVFRHALLGNSGQSISLPATNGQSLKVTGKIAIADIGFDVTTMSAVAIVNSAADKSVIQSISKDLGSATRLDKMSALKTLILYPNPTTHIILAEMPVNQMSEIMTISDIHGKIWLSFLAIEMEKGVEVSGLAAGMYILNGAGIAPISFVKK